MHTRTHTHTKPHTHDKMVILVMYMQHTHTHQHTHTNTHTHTPTHTPTHTHTHTQKHTTPIQDMRLQHHFRARVMPKLRYTPQPPALQSSSDTASSLANRLSYQTLHTHQLSDDFSGISPSQSLSPRPSLPLQHHYYHNAQPGDIQTHASQALSSVFSPFPVGLGDGRLADLKETEGSGSSEESSSSAGGWMCVCVRVSV